jgi:hypothetical protein
MRDAAGCNDYHAVGAVLAFDEVVKLPRGEGLHRFRRAEDGAADRLVTERRLREAVEDDIVGRVVGRTDLLQDHMLLALELGRIEFRIGQDIGKDVDGQWHIVLEHPRIERRRLDAGGGIYLAADILDFRGDLPRIATAGTLERHVFEEVRKAMLVVAFVTRAGLDPDAKATDSMCGRVSVATVRPFDRRLTSTPIWA